MELYAGHLTSLRTMNDDYKTTTIKSHCHKIHRWSPITGYEVNRSLKINKDVKIFGRNSGDPGGLGEHRK